MKLQFKTENPLSLYVKYIGSLILWLNPLYISPYPIYAQPIPQHKIYVTADSIKIDGILNEPAWQSAPVIKEFSYPWFTNGQKELTEARLIWDNNYLYVAFVAHDKFISAYNSERDSPVSQDDCVEVFIAPDTTNIQNYFNYEFNALCTVLDRAPYNNRDGKWNSNNLKVTIKIRGTLNDHSDIDTLWTTEVAIPLQDFKEFAPNIPPKGGDRWRLNLYRTGGEINLQYSTWSATLRPKPQFHAPERFGIVEFSDKPPYNDSHID